MINNIYIKFKSEINELLTDYKSKDIVNKKEIEELNSKITLCVKRNFELIREYLETQDPSKEEEEILQRFRQEVDDIAKLTSNLGLSVLVNPKGRVNSHDKALELISSFFQKLPEDPSEVSGDFTNIPLNQLEEEIEAEKASASELPTFDRVVDGKKLYASVLSELDRLKDKLGGSPIFRDKPIEINEDDNKKTVFGVPMAAVKDWLRMVIDEKWFPTFFWKNVAKLFNVSESTKLSQYEEAHIRIQRFGMLIANKERFLKILEEEDQDRFIEFLSITGLAWHPQSNGKGIEKIYMEFVEQFLTTYFEEAKKKGDDALIEYFNIFKGVCFEDRAKEIEEYARKHPLPGLEEIAKAAEAKDWDSSNSAEEAFAKEFIAYGVKLAGTELLTPKGVFKHFQEKGIFDTEFVKGDSKAKPTLEQFLTWALEQISGCLLEAFPTEELLQVELDIFKTKGKEATVSNFIEQLKTIQGENDGFSVDEGDTKQIIEKYVTDGLLTR